MTKKIKQFLVVLATIAIPLGIAVTPSLTLAGTGDDDSELNPGFNTEDAGGWKTQKTDYNANVAGSDKLKGDSLIKTIQTAINWVLGLLSLIALALCLWGGFQMMTSGGDSKKYESGLNILKWAAIGLAIIAASWLIVSLIFYVINGSIKGGNSGKIDGQIVGAGNDA